MPPRQSSLLFGERVLSDRKIFIFVAVVVALLVPAATYFSMSTRGSREDPVQVLIPYLNAVYARDYREAYRLISSEDQRLKDEQSYVRERGAFSGFTLEVAKRLAGFIEAMPVEENIYGGRVHLKLKLRLPDANKLSANFLDWDEERLNKLSPKEQRELIEKLDRWRKEGKIPMIEGEHDFKLVREDKGWRISLNWAAGVRVSFHTVVPKSLSLEAKPVHREVIVPRGEPFNVSFKVRNLSNREVSARIAHRVEPEEMAEYLELIQCSLLLPIRLQPEKEEEYSSAYLLRGDLPEEVNQFKVTYEFKMEEQ